MQSDFLNAHERHWQDAEQLFEAERWANADHLFGLAAECGLKRLMEMMGQGGLTRQDYVHVMEVRKPTNAWERFEAYRNGHLHGPSYVLPSINPFQDWDVSQRYANQANFNKSRVEPHRKGANEVGKLIRKAQLEGLL